MSERENHKMELVYGIYRLDELLFMPLEEARDRAKLWRALETAVTWGELGEAIPARFFEELVGKFDDEGLFLPEEDDVFEPDMIPGNADGDWPSWPAQDMLDWMPSDVQERCGKRITTVLNGDYLRLPYANESEIVALLEEHGYTCRRNDGLVQGATGWASYGAAGFDLAA